MSNRRFTQNVTYYYFTYLNDKDTIIFSIKMNRIRLCFLVVLNVLLSGAYLQNLSCYQCTRNKNVECDITDLKPCKSAADRCVTHITKNSRTNQFKISRECGLAPCTFEEINVNNGFGFASMCDPNRDDYFCTFCCKGSGCNKNNLALKNFQISKTLIIFLIGFCRALHS